MPYKAPPPTKSLFQEIKEGVQFIVGMFAVLGLGAASVAGITLVGTALSFLLGGH